MLLRILHHYQHIAMASINNIGTNCTNINTMRVQALKKARLGPFMLQISL